ncbi:MAG: glycosyltransferase [Tabrizicola sp.]|nr:glycosyltransferase [Tabrizicola sp.]
MMQTTAELASNLADYHAQPLVSVALITYNHSAFVAEAIESVLAQTYENLEIVVADDFSTDGTREIVEQYVSRFPNKIKLCHATENLGVTKNHNRAFKGCSGKYISWMSGDDIMLPEKIFKQVRFMECHPDCVICYHDLEYFRTEDYVKIYLKSEVDRPLEGNVNLAIKYGCFNGGVSNMVRRSAAPTGGFDERIPIASDWLFWVETLAGGGRINFINEVLARHRRHSSNVTSFDIRTPSLREIQDHLMSSEIIVSKYPKKASLIQFRKSRIYWSLRWADGGKFYNDFLRLSLKQKWNFKAFIALLASEVFGTRK